MCTAEAHSTLHPQGLPDAAHSLQLKQLCGQTADRSQTRVADELRSRGGARPAERQMDLLYTVCRTINLRNHADNYDAKRVY